MGATAVQAKSVELVARGNIRQLLNLPDEIVKHGDNVHFELTWLDQAVIPETVAMELEMRMRQIGCIPADGCDRMVVPDPEFLRVRVNYREQSPELGLVTGIIGGLGLLGTGAAFFLFREQTERFLGEQTNVILIVIAVASAALVGVGIFLAMNEGRRPALR